MVDYTNQNLNAIFHALADPTRRAVLDKISKSKVTVSELAEPFNMSLAAVSKHLKVLEKANLITRQKSGREYYFCLNADSLKTAEQWIAQYEKFWTGAFDRLDALLKTTRQ